MTDTQLEKLVFPLEPHLAMATDGLIIKKAPQFLPFHLTPNLVWPAQLEGKFYLNRVRNLKALKASRYGTATWTDETLEFWLKLESQYITEDTIEILHCIIRWSFKKQPLEKVRSLALIFMPYIMSDDDFAAIVSMWRMSQKW